MKLFTTLILLLATISISGQSVGGIEKELIEDVEKIWEVSNYAGKSDSYKQDEVNKNFSEKLLRYTNGNAATLEYNFKELKKHMSIETSPDGKLRTYSWDTGMGGSMHFYATVYQFVGEDSNVYSFFEDIGDYNIGKFYTDIFNLKAREGTVYLAVSNSRFSTSYMGQVVYSFEIEGKNLNRNYRIFKTRTGLMNSISFVYDFFSVVDRPERPLKLIHYNSKRKEVLIPVVIEDKKTPQGRVTNRFIKYKFNGKYFVKVKR